MLLVGGLACATGGRGTDTYEPLSLRVVSYNIRHGRGMDDQVNLERTAAVLRRLQPDIVALQEVDSSVARSGGVAEGEFLGRRLGMHHAFGGFFAYQGGQYGLAVLSRYPVRAALPVRLPDGNEPRVALAVVVGLPDGRKVMVVNVHLDWVENDSFRFRQAEALAPFLDTLTMPVILTGDFNDIPGSRTLGLFADRFTRVPKPATDRFTFSSIDPVKEIDHVFTAPADAWTVQSTVVIAEPAASDHRPVLTVLVLR